MNLIILKNLAYKYACHYSYPNLRTVSRKNHIDPDTPTNIEPSSMIRILQMKAEMTFD